MGATMKHETEEENAWGPRFTGGALCFSGRRELMRPHRLCGACRGWNQHITASATLESAELGGKRLVGLLDLRDKSMGTRG
jgi:hypothetical protein